MALFSVAQESMSNGLKKAVVTIPNVMNLVIEAIEETLIVLETVDEGDQQADHHAERGALAEAEVEVAAHHQEEEVTELHTILVVIEVEALVEEVKVLVHLVALVIEVLQKKEIRLALDLHHQRQGKKGIHKTVVAHHRKRVQHHRLIHLLNPLLLFLSKLSHLKSHLRCYLEGTFFFIPFYSSLDLPLFSFLFFSSNKA